MRFWTSINNEKWLSLHPIDQKRYSNLHVNCSEQTCRYVENILHIAQASLLRTMHFIRLDILKT